MIRIYDTATIDWNDIAVGDRVTIMGDSLDEVKKLRAKLKRQAGELLIGLRWGRPEPVTYLLEREGTVGLWRDEEFWHINFLVTRRIIYDWQIRDDFPGQSIERANLNTTTLYDVAN